MAAIFYNYKAGDIFNTPVTTVPISIDFFDNIIGENGMAIYTDIGIQTNQTVQIFLTFDDVINFFHFGKGVGTISISGLLFADCNGSMPGITGLYNAVSAAKGSRCTVSLGSEFFIGTLMSTNASIVSDPDMMIQFSISLAMIDNSI